MIEVMLACVEKPALAIGNSIPRIGTYPRILLADLPIEIDVAVVTLRRTSCPYPIMLSARLPGLGLLPVSASPARPEAPPAPVSFRPSWIAGDLDQLDQVGRKDRQHLLLASGYLSTAFVWQTA